MIAAQARWPFYRKASKSSAMVLKPNHFRAIKLLNYIFSPTPVLHTKEAGERETIQL